MEGKNPLVQIGEAIGLVKRVNPAEVWKAIDERDVQLTAKELKQAPGVINDMRSVVENGAYHVDAVLANNVAEMPVQYPEQAPLQASPEDKRTDFGLAA